MSVNAVNSNHAWFSYITCILALPQHQHNLLFPAV